MRSGGWSFSCHLRGPEHLAEAISGTVFKNGVAVPKRGRQENAA